MALTLEIAVESCIWPLYEVEGVLTEVQRQVDETWAAHVVHCEA